jgi:hypothetical protein
MGRNPTAGLVLIESNAPDAFVCAWCHRQRARVRLGCTITLTNRVTGKVVQTADYCDDCEISVKRPRKT